MYDTNYTIEQARKWTSDFLCTSKPIPAQGWTEKRRVIRISGSLYSADSLHPAVRETLSRMGFEIEEVTVRVVIE